MCLCEHEKQKPLTQGSSQTCTAENQWKCINRESTANRSETKTLRHDQCLISRFTKQPIYKDRSAGKIMCAPGLAFIYAEPVKKQKRLSFTTIGIQSRMHFKKIPSLLKLRIFDHKIQYAQTVHDINVIFFSATYPGIHIFMRRCNEFSTIKFLGPIKN